MVRAFRAAIPNARCIVGPALPARLGWILSSNTEDGVLPLYDLPTKDVVHSHDSSCNHGAISIVSETAPILDRLIQRVEVIGSK